MFTCFGRFGDCILLELTYNEAFSDRQIEIAGPYGPQLPEGGGVVVFDSSWVDNESCLDENTSWNGGTRWMVRADPSQAWAVTNCGVA